MNYSIPCFITGGGGIELPASLQKHSPSLKWVTLWSSPWMPGAIGSVSGALGGVSWVAGGLGMVVQALRMANSRLANLRFLLAESENTWEAAWFPFTR